jgi:hypothetical protein
MGGQHTFYVDFPFSIILFPIVWWYVHPFNRFVGGQERE